MKHVLFCCCVFCFSLAYSQHVTMSPDSSAILFPGDVYVSLKPEVAGSDFVLTRKALSILLTQCNYLCDMNHHFSKLLDVYKKQLVVLDSIQQVSKVGLSVSQQRTDLYSNAYDQSKIVTQEYDKQVRALIDDLSKLKRQQRRQKGKVFLKGGAIGLTIGLILGVVCFAFD